MDAHSAAFTRWGVRLADPELERAFRRFSAPSERRNALVAAAVILVVDAVTTFIDNVIGDAPLGPGEVYVQIALFIVLPSLIVLLARERPQSRVSYAYATMVVLCFTIAVLIASGYQMASRGAVVISAGIMLIYLVGRFTLVHVMALAALFTVVSVPLWLAVAISNDQFDVPFILAVIIILHVIGFFEAKQTQRERRLLFAAQHEFGELSLRDDLTGLGNRRQYYRAIDELGRTHFGHADAATGRHYAVLLADLDHFKDINDTLGHHAGDELLVEVAARLRQAIPDAHAHIRLGGDEYVAIVPTDADGRDAVRDAERFLAVLREPIRASGLGIHVRASIGIAIGPPRRDSTLLREADVAMYRAKQHSTRIQVYTPHEDVARGKEYVVLAGEFAESLARPAVTQGGTEHSGGADGLTVFYQPQVEIGTGIVHSVEALIRWHHPRRGLLGPDVILQLAEQQGLLRELTRWVVRTVLAQLHQWINDDFDIRIAVNLTPIDMLDDDFPDTIATLLRDSDVPARNLRLEITEDTMLADPDRILGVLSRLRAMGIAFALDDYGTGYSSLTHLRLLPVDLIKIDRSFVSAMTTHEADATIVRSTVEMAHGLGFRLLAEGVENEQTWHALAAIGCDGAQGFYIARPMPADDATEWLRRHRDGFYV